MIELQAAAGYELMTAATVCSESARERRFSLGYRPIREGMVLCKKEGLYWNDITGAPSESRLHALIGQRRTERHEMGFFLVLRIMPPSLDISAPTSQPCCPARLQYHLEAVSPTAVIWTGSCELSGFQAKRIGERDEYFRGPDSYSKDSSLAD